MRARWAGYRIVGKVFHVRHFILCVCCSCVTDLSPHPWWSASKAHTFVGCTITSRANILHAPCIVCVHLTIFSQTYLEWSTSVDWNRWRRSSVSVYDKEPGRIRANTNVLMSSDFFSHYSCVKSVLSLKSELCEKKSYIWKRVRTIFFIVALILFRRQDKQNLENYSVKVKEILTGRNLREKLQECYACWESLETLFTDTSETVHVSGFTSSHF